MPKALEHKLEREASRKGLTGRRRDAYVYGTIARVEKKHRAKRRKTSKKGRR